MPFFYSQYLKDEKSIGGGSRLNSHPAPRAASGGNPQRRPSRGIPRQRSLTKPGALVWHSGTGASGKTGKAPSNFKPLGHTGGKGKKVVHFSTIEVQPFHFDWNLANEVFYTRAELTVMGQSRFDDAATLRQQRGLDENGAGGSTDDVGISKKSKFDDIADLLAKALEDEDRDENVTIRGIEHFVYPGLQQEMIRRKKEVQKEVMTFVRSKRPDPQGWRLAEHSRSFSMWARNVALEKGMKYCMNNAAVDPEAAISDDELERFQKSQDKLDSSSRSLRGSSSFAGRGSSSFDADNSTKVRVLHDVAEGDKHGSQLAGASTGEV